MFYKQCELNKQQKKLIGLTCDGYWHKIVEAVVQTNCNIVQIFLTLSDDHLKHHSQKFLQKKNARRRGNPSKSLGSKL